ncbi:MAG: hypothetical protein DMD89_35905 [Candidatus Rokuibacteriota bacterium]|nr:MAG: hypothetical protein DMD89_35905 [Candidatus Rokubacteria bacterium]
MLPLVIPQDVGHSGGEPCAPPPRQRLGTALLHWPVFRCPRLAGFGCPPRAMGTKRPLFPWIEFQSRRPTAAEMSAWYRRDPRAGVAIVCDAVSGLAVVDFDPRNSDGTARAVPRQEFCCLRQP